MKLAEALILRADVQKRLAQLRERLTRNAKVQEGDKPTEDPQTLLAEHRQLVGEYTVLMQRINRTNAATAFNETSTLTDALAERDALVLERNTLNAVVEASATPDFRYGRAEIKYLATIDVSELQRQIDTLARQYRELDTAIQQMNWQVDLI